MKWLTFILLLGCTEIDYCKSNCFDMNIPVGNPVKFWLNGEESFNTKVVAGMQQVCFNQKFNNGDELVIQFYDAGGDSFELVVKDADGEFLGKHAFTETADYYNLSLTLTPYADKKIKLEIFNTDQNIYLLIPTSWSDDGLFSALGKAGTYFIKSSTDPTNPYAAYMAAVITSGITPKPIRANIAANLGMFANVNIYFEYVDGAETVMSSSNTVSLTDDFTGDLNFSFSTSIGTSTKLRLVVLDNAGTSNEVIVNVNVGDLIVEGTKSAFSDYLDIADHEETLLIQYSDKSNYAGLDYSDETIFGIRLEGRFAKERTQEENESDQTADGDVEKLSSSLKDQRLLEIEYAPPYIHKLMKRVLNHNTIYIDGQYWVKEDSYDTRDVSNSQPLQPATCWLTQKEDGYDTNVYGTKTTI